MGTLQISEFVSLDGVAEAPNEWNIPYVNATMGAAIEQNLLRASALLYGRTTYEVMAAAWPTRSGAVADCFNELPKYVVSRTLKQVDWRGSKLLAGDVAPAVEALKKAIDGEIHVWGSLALVETLIRNDLVDEYLIYVHPLVLGKGKRVFPDDARQKLDLVEAKMFETGVVLLRYRRET